MYFIMQNSCSLKEAFDWLCVCLPFFALILARRLLNFLVYINSFPKTQTEFLKSRKLRYNIKIQLADRPHVPWTYSCMAHATEICTSWKVSEEVQRSMKNNKKTMCIRLALCATKTNSVKIVYIS